MSYTTINKSTDYFNTKLHTGDGGGSGSSTGIGFQPDMVWSKSRTEALNHTMFDSVRGVGSNKELTPNATSPEGGASSAGFGYISAFNSDGYSWTAGSTNTENFNKSSQTYVNWCWKANGAGSANTDGSINTTATSANTTAGFSISKYTGTGSAGTIGHGLGAEPHVVIVKKLNSSEQWFSYHKPLGNTGALVLNTTAAVVNDAGYWNSTTPTNQVFYVTSNGSNNASGDTYVAYCFAPKTGYSKFGSLTGNGSTDGSFVYCGFAPAFIMVKAKTAGNWFMYDNKRPGYNNVQQFLEADGSAVEYTSNANHSIDILSNGFKFTGGSGSNTSGRECIFMAFASAPLVGSNNVPCTAR